MPDYIPKGTIENPENLSEWDVRINLKNTNYSEYSNYALLSPDSYQKCVSIYIDYVNYKKFPQMFPLFEEEFKLPKTKGDGNNRKQLKEAIQLLEDAGYELGEDGYRYDPKTGKKLKFEIIENQPTFERWIAPMIANLKKIGIEASFRTIDTAQYQNRILEHDYDMTVQVFGQSLSPGNEQVEYWHSTKADQAGSRNWAGIKDPVVDALVDKIVHAESRDDLVTASRALDRVLLWNYYVVPQWHLNSFRVAYWDKFGQPSKRAPYNLNILDTWWAKK